MTAFLLIILLAGQFIQKVDEEQGFDYYLDGFSRNSEVNPDSALYFANMMLDVAHRNDDNYGVVRAEYALGYTYKYMNDYVNAIRHYRNSWQLARSNGFEEREMMATNGLGLSMYRAGNNVEALRYLYLSLFIREERGIPDELSTIYNNIGLVYLKLWNWQKAYEYLSLALEQRESLQKEDAATLVNLGVCLPNLGRVEEAFEIFAQFQEICGEGCEPTLWCDYYNALGGLYLNQDELANAQIYFEKALSIAQANSLMAHQEISYDNLSMLELDHRNYHTAWLFSDSAQSLALQLGMPQRVQNNYRQMAELKTRMGNYAEALSLWQKYDSMRLMVTGEEVMNDIYTQELEWMKSSYNQELDLQREIIRNSRRANTIFVIMSVVVGLLALLWWHNYRRKKQTLERLEKAQEQLIRHEKLAALGSLMAGIAHELSNPLAAALASVESGVLNARQLLRQYPGLVGEASDQMFTGMERRRIRKDLIHDLPDWKNRETIAEGLLDLGISVVPDSLRDNVKHEELMDELNARLLEKDLERIGQSLEGMRSVIRSLQDSSRGSGSTYVITEVDLINSINGTLILLHNQLKYGITLRRCWPDHVPAIMANPQRLSQVWINILVNSIQSLPDEGGEINIRIDDRFADFIHVEIADNACGISTEDQPHVFEKFYTTRYTSKGNGLGLHIVKEIVGEFDGKISFTSSGRGTSMHVFLPRM